MLRDYIEKLEFFKSNKTEPNDTMVLMITKTDNQPEVSVKIKAAKSTSLSNNTITEFNKYIPESCGRVATDEEKQRNIHYIGFKTWDEFINQALIPASRGIVISGSRYFEVEIV